MKFISWFLFCFLILSLLSLDTIEAFRHHKGGGGTGCVVKGSHCSCHYCKCEKGWVHCSHKGHFHHQHHGHGKKFCYGSTEGQYCHCDYCKCKHGYGFKHNHKGQCGHH